MDSELLHVKNLTTKLLINGREVAIVDDLSFRVPKGKTVALVGESGCGKTMTALSVMRILPVPPCVGSTGEVMFKGKNLLDLSEKEMRSIRGGKIAMIFQDPSSSLNPVYTIGEQLMEACAIHLSLPFDAAYEKCVRALSDVGIASPKERFDDYPHQMSGGMRQRVMIAMSLIGEPELLIADEPTTALDVTIQAQIIDILRGLQNSRGMSVLLITHDMGIVAEMADDVVVMYAAQGVERGACIDIFDRMSHPYTKGLFASRPSLQKAGQKLHPISGHVPSVAHFPEGCRFHPRCPYAMPKCRQGTVPEFKAGGESLHEANCWLLDGTEESGKKREEVDR